MAEEGGSWWKTLPGLFTALAGLITAATASYVAISRHDGAAGANSGSAPSTPSVAAKPDAPSPTVVAQQGATAPTAQCTVAGQVYNQDDSKPIASTRILVVNGSRVHVVATSGPDGRFSGSCAQFPASAFPLHLKVSSPQWRCAPNSTPMMEQIVESVPAIGAPNLNIPVSMTAIAKKKLLTCRT